MLNIKTIVNNKWFLLLISALLFIAYFIPYLADDPYILIHDNLDSSHAKAKVVANRKKAELSSNEICDKNYFAGLPKRKGPDFSLRFWIYYFFDPYIAIIIGQIIIRLTAFIGMYLLISRFLIKDNKYQFLACGAALTFSLLPFYPSIGVSVAGQPLVLYSFLNFRENKQKIRDWIIIILIPFYSSFVLSFIFFLIIIFGLWIYDLIKHKRISIFFLISIAVMTLSYVLVNYRLFFKFFIDENFVSHRTEFSNAFNTGFFGSLLNAKDVFLYGQYHASSIHFRIILPTVIAALAFILVRGLNSKLFFKVFIMIILISGFFGFWDWRGLEPLKMAMGVFSSFNFSRFHFLLPMLWYILFALSAIVLINQMPRYGKQLVAFIFLCQVLILYNKHECLQKGDQPSYNEFYSPDLFKEIIQHIGRKPCDYRVISVGLHPAISQYNGFYTIDGYFTNYPLSYKHEFRKIIAEELDKDEDLKNYFDNWGSRCYAYSAEIGRNLLCNDQPVIHHLDFNYEQIISMGAEYILSSAEINSDSNEALILNGVFGNENSYWTIYLYEINKSLIDKSLVNNY